MHIARFSSDEGFIGFDLARQFIARFVLMGQSDSVKHEPSGLLADAKSPMNLPGRYAVFGIGNQPHCRKPLFQTDRGILEDRPDLDGKLATGMV
jgi:hypothetical protein